MKLVDRLLRRVLLISAEFFIWLSVLSIPVLALYVVAGGIADVLHDAFGIGKGIPPNMGFAFFAGAVFSFLLFIGVRVGAFDKLFQKEEVRGTKEKG